MYIYIYNIPEGVATMSGIFASPECNELFKDYLIDEGEWDDIKEKYS